MSQLQFDFLVNKENNTLTIKREFAAERQLVWDCYTQSELLNQWFAPYPFSTKTKSMAFNNGGHWHYAMVDQDGNHHWGFTTYNNIKPIDSYETTDVFSNEAGEINTDLPQAKWFVTFIDKGSQCIVETIVQYSSLKDLEMIVNMGMEEGFKATIARLDILLEKLKK